MKHLLFPKWQPADDLPDIWLDATNTATTSLKNTSGGAITNGASVGHWISQGNFTGDFIKFATNGVPTWVSSGINGLASVKCVAAASPNAQGLGITSPTGFLSMSAMTVLVVQTVHLTTPFNGSNACSFAFTTSHDTRSADESLVFMDAQLTPRQVSGRRVQAASPDSRVIASGDNVALDAPHIQCGVFDWSNAKLSLHQNGKLRVNQQTFETAGATSSNPPFGVAIGGFLQEASGSNVLASPFDGMVGEVLVWKNRAFTPDQLVGPSAYLAQKWNPGLPAQF